MDIEQKKQNYQVVNNSAQNLISRQNIDVSVPGFRSVRTVEKTDGRVGFGREKGEVADPARYPAAFSIVSTDREPGTG